MAETYRPPQGVRNEAKRALAWIADGKAGSGFTDTGRKRAADLAAGRALSAQTVLRMYSFLKRHEVDKKAEGFNAGEDGFPTPGRVAWSAWGGDPGLSWSSKIRDQLAKSARALALPILEEEDDMADTLEGQTLPEELTELLADVITFYFRAHGAHWNVKGPDFAEYHALFEAIYEDVYSSIDPIAENLRKIGAPAPFQLSAFAAMSELQDTNVGTDARALATDLLVANDLLIDELTEAFACANDYNQQGIANFLADRIDAHQKWKWQLSSSLGVEATPAVVESEEDDTEDDSADKPAETTGVPADRTTEENPMIEERKAAIATAERITMPTEVRAMDNEDGSLRISGYAATFNTEASGLSFREVIAPGAFKRTLKTDNPVFLLVNHDTEQLPLASTQSGTLRLMEDEVGLRMEADLDPSNPRAQELASALKRGDVDKMSFAFTVAPDGDSKEDGIRTLTDLDLFEVSVVTWPAYDSTSVGMRSAQDDLELRRRKEALKLTTLRLRSRKR